MEWNASDYGENAGYVAKYGQEILSLLSPQPEESILDLGCGDGELTKVIAAKSPNVMGIDSSPQMIKKAKERGVNALVMDGEAMPYENKFDAVFSNASLHWMKNSDAVIDNVHRSLKPGGRFCAEMGGEGNIKSVVAAIYRGLKKIKLSGEEHNPWYFPNQEEYAEKLKKAGFEVKSIIEFSRPTKLPTDITGWFITFAQPFLNDIPSDQQENFLQNIQQDLAAKLKNEQGEWIADYVRLRFLAFKK